MKTTIIFLIVLLFSSCVISNQGKRSSRYFNRKGFFVSNEADSLNYTLVLFNGRFFISHDDSQREDSYVGVYGRHHTDTIEFISYPMYQLTDDYDTTKEILPLPEEKFFGMYIHNDTIKLWGKTFVRQKCNCFK